MFNEHEHGMFEVGENIQKFPKQQVREDANQRKYAMYVMSQELTEQLSHMQ